MTVRRKSESGWWEGSKSDGSRGLFPANFVKVGFHLNVLWFVSTIWVVSFGKKKRKRKKEYTNSGSPLFNESFTIFSWHYHLKERTGMKAPQGANTTNRKTWRRSEAPKPKGTVLYIFSAILLWRLPKCLLKFSSYVFIVALPPNARASVLDTQMMGYSLPSLDAFDELTRWVSTWVQIIYLLYLILLEMDTRGIA